MIRTTALLVSAVVLAPPLPAAAQDAAETAVILSGTGQAQGRAQRSLGQSIARGMGAAADTVAATPRSRAPARTHRQQARRSDGGGKFATALPADVDPLERTDAPIYALANGATLRVSGGLRRPVKPSAVASSED
jgi:hypothetical protein